jgi:MFS family permease
MIIAFNALLALATMPVFLAITHYRTPAMLYAGMVVLATLSGMSMGALLAAVTESLPRRIRAGGVGTMYAVAVSVFGGTTQFMVAWLIGLTGSDLVPGWYSVVATLLGLAAAMAMRETSQPGDELSRRPHCGQPRVSVIAATPPAPPSR